MSETKLNEYDYDMILYNDDVSGVHNNDQSMCISTPKLGGIGNLQLLLLAATEYVITSSIYNADHTNFY